MHSFRPQATTKNGHLIFKKQYSKRTKHGHPEPVRAEKTYDYIQFLMASILKARVDDKDCCKGYFSSIRSPKESGPNHWFVRKPRTDLFKDYRSRFGFKKEWGLVKPVYWVLIRDLAYVLFNIVEGTRYRHTVIGTVWFRCPKKFKSKFIQYIIIINYYYSLVDACCYYEMRVTQELTTDIHTVTRTVWFCCPKKFKSKFIHYIIIKNYYYSLVDACCYYEMRVPS